MGLFSRKKVEEKVEELASDKVIMEQIEDDDNRAYELVNLLKNGNPLVINFDNLDRMAANKMLAFFSGACVAVDGNIVKIREATYLFARKADFVDGSLKELLEEIQN